MTLADDLLAVLDDPTHMWSHALKELSNDGQRLFLTLTLLPKPVSSDVLQIAYTSQKITPSESFLDSLRSLDDSFINIGKRFAHLRSISFRNPSLEDFANAYLSSNFDWLDILLSSPRYFEQVTNLLNLAMAQTVTDFDPEAGIQRAPQAKYPGIKTWTEHRIEELIRTAVDLLTSDKAEIHVDARKSRFSELLAIISTYGMPVDPIVVAKLKTAAESAINPYSESYSDIMLELLSRPDYRALLERLIQRDAVRAMRGNILDKDSWKFAALNKLDDMLDVDFEETWPSWGDEYLDFARARAEDLANSDDDDALQAAIYEMNNMGELLTADLYAEIEMLEQRRRDLPEEEDYDDTSESRAASRKKVDESAQLDAIFESLL